MFACRNVVMQSLYLVFVDIFPSKLLTLWAFLTVCAMRLRAISVEKKDLYQTASPSQGQLYYRLLKRLAKEIAMCIKRLFWRPYEAKK